MAVTKEGYPCTPRKQVIEPVFDGGEYRGVRISMTAEVAVPGVGKTDIGQVAFVQSPEEMDATDKAIYERFASLFDRLAVEQLGCILVEGGE